MIKLLDRPIFSTHTHPDIAANYNLAEAERCWIINTLEKIVEHLNERKEPQCLCHLSSEWNCPIHGHIHRGKKE